MVDTSDVIMCANFGDDWLRGLRIAGDQTYPVPIGFHRHFYNTEALTCLCMIDGHDLEAAERPIF